MPTPEATKRAVASLWVYRAGTDLDDPAGSPRYVIEPEDSVLTEDSAAALLAAETKPIRLSVSREADVLRVEHSQVVDPTQLQFLRRRSSTNRAYWQERLGLRAEEIRVFLRTGRLTMVVPFEEYLTWLGEYSLSNAGQSGSFGTIYPEAKAAGAHIYVDASSYRPGEEPIVLHWELRSPS
jgi:hypothetical protein